MKLLKKQSSNIEWIIKSKGAVQEVIGNVKILRYDVEIKGECRPALALFVGNSSKARSNYYYNSEDSREEEIARVVKREAEILAEKKEVLAKRKAFIPTSKPGDIFVSSWGYDQTQVDFYLLQSIKGKTGTFVAIGSTTVEGSEGYDSDRVVANPNIICGKPFKKLITFCGSTEKIRLKSYEYCHKWGGSSMHRSWGR